MLRVAGYMVLFVAGFMMCVAGITTVGAWHEPLLLLGCLTSILAAYLLVRDA